MDSLTGSRRDLAHYPDELAYIQRVCARMKGVHTRGELGLFIAREVSHYSMYDLQVIGGKLRREVDRLPSPYREAVRPYFEAQLFGMHHTLLAMQRAGVFQKMQAPIADREAFLRFCELVPPGCFSWDRGAELHSHFYRPRHRLFYYLLAGFAMFALGRPGHPVGMPFPGGFTVEERNGSYLCPVRDKEKEVAHSLCNVCPARQSEMPK
jgi:uncharacterized protein (UPF0305 family)